MTIAPAYRYRAELNRMIDGDTYILDVDLGFRVYAALTIRLHGYSCPELREPNGPEAMLFAQAALMVSDSIVVESYRDQQSFARWVADVYVDGEHLGEQLWNAGLATK